MKKRLFTGFCLITILFSARAQSIHTYTDTLNHFKLTYPDSEKPLLLGENEDPKAQVVPFAIGVYTEGSTGEKGKQTTASLIDSIKDDCYSQTKTGRTKHKMPFKMYTCTEGAMGKTYYNYIFKLDGIHCTILLKFLNSSCNACEDENGKPAVYDEQKALKRIMAIVNSVKITP
jgi:hypothetical protein